MRHHAIPRKRCHGCTVCCHRQDEALEEVQVAKEVEVDAVAGKEECVVVVAEMVAVAKGQC